jgi:hypothetical protein
MAARTARLGSVALAAGLALCLCLAFMGTGFAQAAEPPLYRYSFGPDGTETSNFESVGAVAVDQATGAVYVIDRAAGTVYEFDEEGQPIGQITGLSFLSGANESQVAVDSTSHVVYVTSSNSVLAFHPDGTPATFSAGPGSGTNQILGFGELLGVAVDANGDIYASDYYGQVRIYEPTGGLITEFATSEPANLAVAPDGSVYVSRWHGPVLKFTPSAFPVTASTTYTPASEPLDADALQSESVAVDPATGNVYVPEAWESFGSTRIAVYDPAGNRIMTFGGPGEEGELAGFTPGVAIKGSSGRVFVGTDDASGATSRSQVEVFTPEEIFEGPPTVVATGVSDVTADTAILRASINPNTAETAYHFEYGTEDCGVSPGSCIVAPGGSIPAGHRAVAVSQAISGLQPGTTYFYRVVAENSFDTTVGSERTFTTQGSALGFALSDSRAWEMVSPSDKFAGVITSAEAGAVQAAEDGNGLVYQSLGSIEAASEGNRAIEPSTVLAHRTATGWNSKDITVPHSRTTALAEFSEYDLFTQDLSKALLEPRDATPLSPASSERTPYLRLNSEPPSYTPLVTAKDGFANVPSGTKFGGQEPSGQVSDVSVAGASPDLEDVVLVSKVPLVEGTSAKNALYLWKAGHLSPISQLPDDEGGMLVPGLLGSEKASVRHAVSDDGSRVFWSTGNIGAGGIHLSGLYVRDTVTEETTRLDVVQPGIIEEGEPLPAFQSASSDGTVVFFTDSQRLTADASPTGRDLYRCEILSNAPDQGCAELTDLSATDSNAELRGLIPATGENGDTAYFIANGVLDTGSNPEGDHAVGGEPNLYYWHEGEGARFIARLAQGDSPDWGEEQNETPRWYVRLLSAAGSPDGRYFAFMSQRSLTGEENEDASTGEPVERVFQYDAERDRLACVSCNPTGASPRGQQGLSRNIDKQRLWEGASVSAALPQTIASAGQQLDRYAVYQPRTVLNNGRVFFHAYGDLVPGDSNRNWDVYQYEPFGMGSCDAASTGPAISRSDEGCLSLISSGTAEKESSFIDSSASGDDVFFLTLGRLSALDKDTVLDVYDARVGGVAASVMPASECAGADCRLNTVQPSHSAPAAETFRGPGNAKKRCPRGRHKVQRHGKVRCVRHRHRHHHKPRTRSDVNRRVGR